MCLALIAKVVSIDGKYAQVRLKKAEARVFLSFDGARTGDHVLIHGGLALRKVEDEEARETEYLMERAQKS